ncbi:flavin reductase family protein [Pedobacter hartonius]|uniref:NADH-FMN oxidoreductase RutF, flavin reductase (DIM6/NTAB) family n=1 Tax=Pedobacter hartonius TaxID=425514 RepID=A0A1H3W2V9_9SPHI|nr:flavin reductase [Pedobacter hartonius]SDZ81201.1 NADH-FMN oxidoreductase RutF, flavin reductase (DIM6/NTAB) family [Pedobacter hartonius]
MQNIKSEQIHQLEKNYRTSLINSIIGYRALNLLGTTSNEGITNLCIISSVFHLGANPPLIGMVIRPEREHNDTLRNIRSTGQYTLNNVLPEWYMHAHQTSASYPSGVSEFDTCHFKKHYVNGFKAPFVEASNVQIGLELREIIEMEINGTTLVIGEIVHILTAEGLIGSDGTLDHGKAKTMTVAGLDTYYLPQLFGQLAYAKPEVEPHVLNANANPNI